VGGVSKTEMNTLELEFLFLIEFNLHVTTPDYEAYRSALNAKYDARPPLPVPEGAFPPHSPPAATPPPTTAHSTVTSPYNAGGDATAVAAWHAHQQAQLQQQALRQQPPPHHPIYPSNGGAYEFGARADFAQFPRTAGAAPPHVQPHAHGGPGPGWNYS